MALAQLKLMDGELVVPVPPEAMSALSLHEGSEVEVTFAPVNQSLPERQLQIPHYDLNELLDQWEQMPEEMKGYREWVDAPRIGRELI